MTSMSKSGVRSQKAKSASLRLDDARLAGVIFDGRAQLVAAVFHNQVASGRFDHRTDFHEQPAAGLEALGRFTVNRSITSVPRGPATSAWRGSKSRTSGGSRASSLSLTYGGLLAMIWNLRSWLT